MPIQAAPTVRESVEAAVETVLTPTDAPVVDAPVVDTPAPEVAEATATAPAEPKDDRPRDKDGKFIKAEEKAKVEAKVETPAAPQPPAKPKVPRPTSWKKELEPHWETLPPEVQAYVNEREKQYATGVSTYKGEADRAKGVMDAVNQFVPMLQAMKIEPAHWIKNLGVAHHFLANGTPQEKVQTVADIIRNNRVDAQALLQVLSGQQPTFQQPQGQPTPLPQQQQQPMDIESAVQQALDKRRVEDLYTAFTADVEAGKYPHFADDEVKGTMAGLLQAGLAQDYPSAYEAALAMPKHKHLAAPAPSAPAPVVPDPAVQRQAQAARARSQAVSVKSSTPSTMTQPTGKRSLREELESSVDKVLGGGRV